MRMHAIGMHMCGECFIHTHTHTHTHTLRTEMVPSVPSGPNCSESVWSCLTVSADRRLSEVKHAHLPQNPNVIDTDHIKAKWKLNWTEINRTDSDRRGTTRFTQPPLQDDKIKEFFSHSLLIHSYSGSQWGGESIPACTGWKEMADTRREDYSHIPTSESESSGHYYEEIYANVMWIKLKIVLFVRWDWHIVMLQFKKPQNETIYSLYLHNRVESHKWRGLSQQQRTHYPWKTKKQTGTKQNTETSHFCHGVKWP